jgi:hypothetical protein
MRQGEAFAAMKKTGNKQQVAPDNIKRPLNIGTKMEKIFILFLNLLQPSLPTGTLYLKIKSKIENPIH